MSTTDVSPLPLCCITKLFLFSVSIGDMAGYLGTGISGAVDFLRPSNLKKRQQAAVDRLRQKTYGQIIVATGKAGFRATYNVLWFLLFLIM